MGGTTAAGIPYVTPDDHPKEYPAVSQQLAETLSQGLLPIGAVIAYGGTTAPQGWHLCDGTPHGSPDLNALIGPNAPDLRGRFVLAASTARPHGSTAGLESVTLDVSQIPSHGHGGATQAQNANHTHAGSTSTDGTHAHVATRQEGSHAETSNTNDTARNAAGDPFTYTGSAGSHAHTFSTGTESANHAHGINAEGGGAAHENMPPYYALTYIIKAL